MGERDYEHDTWIAWYVEDTAGWLELSLAARGAMAELARKLNRKGELTLRRGLSSLAVILRLRWEGELEPAIAELLDAGKILWDESRGLLFDPDYVARRRGGSADRMREKRARDSRSTSDARDVTSVTGVTNVTVTPVLVSLSSPSGSDLSEARDPVAGRDPPPAEPPSGIRAVVPTVDEAMPEWFSVACDSALMVIGGAIDDRPVLWVQYLASRERKGWARAHTDAVSWVSAVVRSERAKALTAPAHRGPLIQGARNTAPLWKPGEEI